MTKFRRLLASIATVGLLLSSIPMASAGYFKDVSDDNVFSGYIGHGVGEGYFTTANEYFYPNNNLSRAELAKIAVIGAGLTEEVNSEHDFKDVKADNAFYMYVETLLNKGMISPNEYFNPDMSVTRAEATKMLVNAFGYELDSTGGPSFDDVSADNQFYAYIETAMNKGLVNGYEDKTFKPNNNITRAEAAKIIGVATGYTGVWGEAKGLVLALSATEVAPGGALNFTVKVVDDNGAVVQDYDGSADFAVSTGKVSEKEVELVKGVASTAYTAPGYGSEGTVTVTVGDFNVEEKFSVVIPEDQRMMLYAVDGNVNTTDTSVMYLTVADDEGRPVTGLSNDLTFDVVEGDATIASVAQFPGGAKGLYRAVLTTAGAATGTNKVEVTNNKNGEKATATVEVSQPKAEVYLLDSAVSIEQATTVLVYLTQGDGSPITGATGNLTVNFLNSNLGTAGADTEIGDGWYYSVLTAQDETAEAAQVKVSYTGVTPNVHNYVSLEIAPYNVAMEVVGSDVNTLNGKATVVLTLTDVNGQPVDVTGGTFNALTDIDFDVITAAYHESPTGDTDWEDANDWFYSFTGLNGVLATQITACGTDSDLCTIDDSDIEVKVRVKSATNEVVELEDTVSFADPTIDTVYAFATDADASGTANVGDTVTMMVKVLDAKSAGVTGLAAEDGTDSDGATPSYFNFDGVDVNEDAIAEVGGGLYLIETAVALSATPFADEFVLELGNTDISDVTVSVEENATAAVKTFVLHGDTSVAEGVGAAEARSAILFANMAINDVLAAVVAPAATAEAPITVAAGAGVDPTGAGNTVGVFGYVISADQADEVETSNVTLSGTNVTYSVRPIKVKHTSVDTNGQATTVTYGYVKALDLDDRLAASGAATNITTDTDGSVNDAEVNQAGGNIVVVEDPAGTDLVGLYGTRFNRGLTNDDSYEGATVEYQLSGDDTSLYIAKYSFDLVNPTYEVYKQSTTTYVAPESVIGGTYTADNAINIVSVVRNDQGVAEDLTMGTLKAEVTSGDGLLDIDLLAGARTDTEDFSAAAPAGVYTINYLPEKDAEPTSIVNIYPSWDDNDDKTVMEFTVEYPQAQVLVFPTKIDPDKTNNEAAILTIVRDSFGNSVNGLVLTNGQDLSVEIEGDQQLTDSYVDGDNSIYYGKYTTDKTGTQEVIAKYNDDETIYESEIVVEMFE